MCPKFSFKAWLTKEKEREYLTEKPESETDNVVEEYEETYTYRKYIFREKPVLVENKDVSDYPYFRVVERNPILWDVFDLSDDMDIPFLREENSPVEVECSIIIGKHKEEPEQSYSIAEFNMWISRDSDGDLILFDKKPYIKSLGDSEYFYSDNGCLWKLETFFNINHMRRKTVFPFIGFTGKAVPCIVSAMPSEN